MRCVCDRCGDEHDDVGAEAIALLAEIRDGRERAMEPGEWETQDDKLNKFLQQFPRYRKR